jgi:hypothetical protein
MNKNRIIGFLILASIALSASSIYEDPFTFWAYNLRQKKEVVNEKPKTVVIITKSGECSGCEKMTGDYFGNITEDPACGLVIIAENNDNVLLRRSRYDYLKSVFKNSSKILFSDFGTDSIGSNKLSKYSRSDFPIVIFIDNKTRYFEGFVFDKIAKTSRFGIAPRKEFEKKATLFLNQN